MKKHSTKTMQKLGIFDELKKRLFIKGKKEYLFYTWDYNRGILSFWFRQKKDINKSLYDNVKCLYTQLYWQHTNNYANTLDLLYSGFDKVEILGEGA